MPSVKVEFADQIKDSYYSYAMSTILSRSLPDVRDGLKPVHRRLLFAMLQLKLDFRSGFKKCARVVGDVIGKYHPHGDTAVYDAMVRLAQVFSLRYPLIDGQGNFGSIDGDNPAAMRYTEAKLTKIANLLLQDIEYDTVKFHDNYDGSEKEPEVLPANFPNLLANGTEGIAVGMSTSIPAHNINELCSALELLLDSPACSIEEIMKHILGPDFATGGIIIDSQENILQAYTCGKGSVKIRARWCKLELKDDAVYEVLVDQLPYQVQKSKLIEKIIHLLQEKKLPLLSNIRDESTEDIRIILEPKNKDVDPSMLMESLFKLTELESRIQINMNVIDLDGVPRTHNIKELLVSFLKHRDQIVLARSKHFLAKIEARIEVITALLIVFLNLDEVIRIIREEEEAKTIIMQRWLLSDTQAEVILNTRLRSLRKLEEQELHKEYKQLIDEQKKYQKLIASEDERKSVIKAEINHYSDYIDRNLICRRTSFDTSTNNKIEIDAFIEKKDIIIIYSKKGWIIAKEAINIGSIRYKQGDSARFVINCCTIDYILIATSDGKFYSIQATKISLDSNQPLSVMIGIADDVNIVNMFVFVSKKNVLLISERGKGFIVDHNELFVTNRNGKQIMILAEEDRLTKVVDVSGDTLAIIGTNRKLLIYGIKEIPVMKKGRGVKLQSYQQATKFVNCIIFDSQQGLSWTIGTRTRTEKDFSLWRGKRGGVGKKPPHSFLRSDN